MILSLPVTLISHQGHSFAFDVRVPPGQDVQKLKITDLSSAESKRPAFDVTVLSQDNHVYVEMPGDMRDGAFIGIEARDSQGKTIVSQRNRITWKSDQTIPFFDPSKVTHSLKNQVITLVGNPRTTEPCADLTIRIKNFSPEVKAEYEAKSKSHPPLNLVGGWTLSDQQRLGGLIDKCEPYSTTEELLYKLQMGQVSDFFDFLLLMEKKETVEPASIHYAGDFVIDRYAIPLLGRPIYSHCFEVTETHYAHAYDNGGFALDIPVKGSGPFVLEFDVQSAPFPEFFPCEVFPKRADQVASMTIILPNVSC